MSSLKQLLIKNSIPNNTPDENMDIFDEIMKLKLKCGCNQYYLYKVEMYYKGEKCKLCNEMCCKNYIFSNICIDCIKQYCKKIKTLKVYPLYYHITLYMEDRKYVFSLFGSKLKNMSVDKFCNKMLHNHNMVY